jgi:hypothetical protein
MLQHRCILTLQHDGNLVRFGADFSGYIIVNTCMMRWQGFRYSWR